MNEAHFGPFEGRCWLNTAHQGALPRVAAAAAEEAVAWKRSPRHLTDKRFADVPARLRRLLGELLGVPGEEVALANSSSYGLHLLANGLPLHPGDEVLLVQGDFPSTILPWLGLAPRGVVARFLQPCGPFLTAADVEAGLTPRTRVLCTTWVHSFTGYRIDEGEIGELCRCRGVSFVLNASQGIGAHPLDLSAAAVDALTAVGFKWLCGPYGTGFCWARPELMAQVQLNQAYWLAAQSATDLESEGELVLPPGMGARRYDVFGTANFFNFHSWAAALEHLLGHGVEAVAAHDQSLVQRLLDGLDRRRYTHEGPVAPERRSTLVFLSHRDPERNPAVRDALARAGVDVALRRGRLRVSPHLYNDEGDVDRLLAALDEAGQPEPAKGA